MQEQNIDDWNVFQVERVEQILYEVDKNDPSKAAGKKKSGGQSEDGKQDCRLPGQSIERAALKRLAGSFWWDAADPVLCQRDR